jgi:hypothetical protein
MRFGDSPAEETNKEGLIGTKYPVSEWIKKLAQPGTLYFLTV